MKLIFTSLVLILSFGGMAQADDAKILPKNHLMVLGCLEGLEISTTWGQCLGAMFGPCAEAEVGSDAHVQCLTTQQQGWENSMTSLLDLTKEAITPVAKTELTEIMDGWTKYAAQKCSRATLGKEGTHAQAAELGCQIAELAGLSGELAACLEGRSKSEYCQIKDT